MSLAEDGMKLFAVLLVVVLQLVATECCASNGAIAQRVIYRATDYFDGCGRYTYFATTSRGKAVCGFYKQLVGCLVKLSPQCNDQSVRDILEKNKNLHRNMYKKVEEYCSATGTAPPVGTRGPAVTTSAPAVTTSAPTVTTSAPTVTTSAPAVTTTTPVMTTMASRTPTVHRTTSPQTPELLVGTTVKPAVDCTVDTLHTTAYGFNGCLRESLGMASLVDGSAAAVCAQYKKVLMCLTKFHPGCYVPIVKRTLENHKADFKGIFEVVDKHDCDKQEPSIG